MLRAIRLAAAGASRATQPQTPAPWGCCRFIQPCSTSWRRSQPPARQALSQAARHPPWAGAATTASAAAAAAAAAEAELEQCSDGPELSEEQVQALLGTLANLRSYAQLAAFVHSQRAAVLSTPLCVYCLLHAAQLRDTLSDEALGKGSLAREEAVLQQLQLVEGMLGLLCEGALAVLPALPLPTSTTVALALAQLDFYHAPVAQLIAASARAELAQRGEPAAAAGGDGSGFSGAEAQPPAGVAPALAQLPDELAPGILLSLCVSTSLSGHYDASLLDAVAEQAVALAPRLAEAGPLVSMAAAFLDLQHYSPALLQAAVQAALDEQGELELEEAVSLLLALAFFRAAGCGEFVGAALEGMAEAGEELLELEPLQLSRLWRALLLLEDQGVSVPGELTLLFQLVAEQRPELLLLGGSKAALRLSDLDAVQAAPPAIRAEWERAGLLAPVQILQVLQGMGHVLEQRVPLQQPAAQQASSGGGAPPAPQLPAGSVELSFVLADGRRVAVLVLDESRYCNNPPNRLRGAAALDVLTLQSLGLAVLPLPVSEWLALEEGQQERYLAARLAAATG